jgi:hypothetical protein
MGGDNTKYIITWYINVLKIGTRRLALGICEKTGCVSHVAVCHPDKPATMESLKPFIVHDVYVDGGCEDARFCIDVECPYNKADLAYWKKYGLRTTSDLQIMRAKMEAVKDELKLKVLEQNRQCQYDKAPMVIRRTVHRSTVE